MTENRSNPVASTPGEEFTVMVVGAVAFGALLSSAGALWWKGVGWLVEQGVLVTGDAVVLEVPGGDGAGVDLSRAIILGAVVIATATLLVSLTVRAVRRARKRAHL